MLRAIGITAAVGLAAVTMPATAHAAYLVPAPYGLHRTAATAHTLSLDWRDVTGATGYRVQLSTHSNMSYSGYYTYSQSAGTMRHLHPLTRYYFRVAVLGADATRLSRYTAAAYPSAYTRALPGPTNLAVASTTESSVALTWSPTSTTDVAYRIAVSRTADFASVIRLRSYHPSKTVTGLDPATAYYFRVVTIRADGTNATRYSTGVQATTQQHVDAPDTTPVVPGPADVRFGSYNVESVSLDKTDGEQRPWRDRRPGVLAGILGEHVDVIGLQEANHGTSFESRLVDGATQFEDIRNGLNSGGQNFELTNPYAANCENAATTYQCIYQDRGVAGSDRILYNKDRIAMVSQGGYFYATQDSAGTPRNLAYAVLRVRQTGSEFLFTSTHLEAHDAATREAQWREMITKVGSLKGSLPVVSVGDFNMQKFDVMAATMLPAMQHAGIGDVLSQEYAVNPGVDVRAQRRINGWINSANHMTRDVATFGYEDRHDKTGNNIDYIFASNALVVKEWKMVLDFDPTTLQVRGIIPSDHNMVRATITIP
jgi:endonuclease/exonuclease/phosphatase family metal-dependent hydrolase